MSHSKTSGHPTHMHSRRVLSVWMLAMMNVSACLALKNFAIMSTHGLEIIFYFGLAGLLLFIPCSLVSAELATGWPEAGGMYVWVREALGKRWAFLAVWCHWGQNLAWFPTQFVFVGAVLAHLINPSFEHSKEFMIATILILYWGTFLLNSLGMKVSGWISTVGAIVGTILPAFVLIGLAAYHLWLGYEVDFDLNSNAIIPKITSLDDISLLAGMFLSIVGMELSAVHAKDVINPQKNYPRAIFLSAILVLGLYMLGTLAVAVLVKSEHQTLVGAVMRAFSSLGASQGVWVGKIMLILILLGAIGSITTWMIAPAKELVVCSEGGELPPLLQKLNRHEMPVGILVLQGIIISIMTILFILLPTVEVAFWTLTAMCGQIYFLVYFLLFLSAIVLRYKFPNVPRAYKIPGGNIGMILVAGTGFTVSILAFLTGYILPSGESFKLAGNLTFIIILMMGLVLFLTPAFVLYSFRRKEWTKKLYVGEMV